VRKSIHVISEICKRVDLSDDTELQFRVGHAWSLLTDPTRPDPTRGWTRPMSNSELHAALLCVATNQLVGVFITPNGNTNVVAVLELKKLQKIQKRQICKRVLCTSIKLVCQGFTLHILYSFRFSLNYKLHTVLNITLPSISFSGFRYILRIA